MFSTAREIVPGFRTLSMDATMAIQTPPPFRGNDKLLFGIIFGVLAFWLFAQTTLNISPTMASDLHIETSVMNMPSRLPRCFPAFSSSFSGVWPTGWGA